MTAVRLLRRIAIAATLLVLVPPAGSAVAADWFVSPTGNDADTCATGTAACLTINGAIGKAAAGDSVKVAVGTYTGAGTDVVAVTKSVTIAGGWDASFATQDGVSTIDAQVARRGVLIDTAVTARLERLVVANGTVDFNQQRGGGIRNMGTLTIDMSTVRNSAAGGGVWSSGSLTVWRSTISDNVSGDSGVAGGITANGTAVLRNTTVTGNTSSTHGGGILVSSSGGTPNNVIELSNVTIVDNTATLGQGGGIYLDFATARVRNSILALNHAGDVGDDVASTGGFFLSQGFNVGSGFGMVPGDIQTTSPLLFEATDNGGPTETIALHRFSPAVNGGNPEGCKDESGAPIVDDQRGALRGFGLRCDVGAFEARPPANDAFGNAIALDTLTAPLAGENMLATKEPGEPDHAANPGGASAWYTWAPTFTGTGFVSSEGSDFDTVLAVYTGAAPASLVVAGASDDASPSDRASTTCFPAVAGTTYHVAVDGWGATVAGYVPGSGYFDLAWGQYTSTDPCAVLSPTVSGTPSIGSLLTATPGSWAGSPAGFTYAWLRCDGLFCDLIDGAASQIYVVTGDDAGYQLGVQVTATQGTDPAKDAIAYSATTATVPSPPSPPGGGGGAAPDVILTKTADRANASVGDTILYRLEARIANVGKTGGATKVVVTDPLPANVEFVSASVNRGPGCAGTRTVVCDLDFLSGTTVGTIEIVVRVVAAGEIVNTATAEVQPGDANPSNNVATARVTPTATVAPAPLPRQPSAAKGVKRVGTARGETLRGTSRADVLRGLGGADRLLGLGGNDLLVGGLGRDVILAGAGNDSVRARDRARDVIRCGAGRDVVEADLVDRVARDCEVVRRR